MLAGLSSEINLAWSWWLHEVQSLQRGFHVTLSNALRVISEKGFEASLMLIGLSFLYGIFHAAGPGHGKVVIATYLLSHKTHLRRGILLSFSSSMVQGLTAIFTVSVAAWFFGLSMKQTRGIANYVELAGFSLIVLVGFFIVATRTFKLLKSFGCFSKSIILNHKKYDEHSCGHSHGINNVDLMTPLSLKTFLGIVLSIGIRPCSGAILVLLLAYSLGLHVAGLVSVLAISIGTALTVSVLATLSVYARQAAKNILVSTQRESASMDRLGEFVRLIGGAIIFFFGLVMITTTLFLSSHPLG